jgi:hypothetical protein
VEQKDLFCPGTLLQDHGLKGSAWQTDRSVMREPATERRVSWLCATQADRGRVLDMERRLKPLRTRSFAVLAGALIVCGPG